MLMVWLEIRGEKISIGMKSSIGINSVALLLSTLGRLSPLTAAFIHNGSTISSLLYVLYGARRSGKTERLIAELSDTGGNDGSE